jgi:outer membrane murein-binding lipoprotein Lpp
MNIYQLSQEKQHLVDLLYFCEDDADATKALNDIEQTLDRKINYLADVVAELNDQAQSAKERRDAAYKRLDAIFKQYDKAHERAKNYLLDAMQMSGKLRAQGDNASYTLCMRQDVNIDKVPMKYYPKQLFKPELTPKERLMTKDAKQFVKDNFEALEFCGAYMTKNYYLRG